MPLGLARRLTDFIKRSPEPEPVTVMTGTLSGSFPAFRVPKLVTCGFCGGCYGEGSLHDCPAGKDLLDPKVPQSVKAQVGQWVVAATATNSVDGGTGYFAGYVDYLKNSTTTNIKNYENTPDQEKIRILDQENSNLRHTLSCFEINNHFLSQRVMELEKEIKRLYDDQSVKKGKNTERVRKHRAKIKERIKLGVHTANVSKEDTNTDTIIHDPTPW